VHYESEFLLSYCIMVSVIKNMTSDTIAVDFNMALHYIFYSFFNNIYRKGFLAMSQSGKILRSEIRFIYTECK